MRIWAFGMGKKVFNETLFPFVRDPVSVRIIHLWILLGSDANV